MTPTQPAELVTPAPPPAQPPATAKTPRTEPAERKPGRRLFRSREERAADKAAALVKRERALIEARRARDQREMEELEAEEEKSRVRKRLADQAKQEQDEAAEEARSLRQRISRAVVLASANVGVNAVAVLGQVLALVLGLGLDWWAAVPIALVVESVAVNVGYIAHDKLVNGYSAGWLRFVSYGIGAAVGWFNYEHNSGTTTNPDGVEVAIPTADYAIVFGAASVLSPVLWQIYSQWKHWQQLRDADLLDARAPKFSRARWILWLGETYFITRRAVRHGVSDRAEAVRRFQPAYEQKKRKGRKPAKPLPPAADELNEALQAWAREYRQRGPEVNVVRVQSPDQDASNTATTPATNGKHDPALPAGATLLRSLMPWTRPDSRPDAALANGTSQTLTLDADLDAEMDAKPAVDATRTRPTDDQDDDRPEPTDKDKRRVARWWAKRVEADEVLSKWALAERTGFKPTWCGDRIAEGKEILASKGWSFDERGRPVRPAEEDADLDASTTPSGDQS
ncbi:hypothetical protein [Nonomuraea sp. NPDC049400]|uniref:hypothetical protein n=1 Tax=Nonomuraea sp. NPDC049400 TaxID=3364352 RepID=UPI003797A859